MRRCGGRCLKNRDGRFASPRPGVERWQVACLGCRRPGLRGRNGQRRQGCLGRHQGFQELERLLQEGSQGEPSRIALGQVPAGHRGPEAAGEEAPLLPHGVVRDPEGESPGLGIDMEVPGQGALGFGDRNPQARAAGVDLKQGRERVLGQIGPRRNLVSRQGRVATGREASTVNCSTPGARAGPGLRGMACRDERGGHDGLPDPSCSRKARTESRASGRSKATLPRSRR